MMPDMDGSIAEYNPSASPLAQLVKRGKHTPRQRLEDAPETLRNISMDIAALLEKVNKLA
jgi:hypothetical protein